MKRLNIVVTLFLVVILIGCGSNNEMAEMQLEIDNLAQSIIELNNDKTTLQNQVDELQLMNEYLESQIYVPTHEEQIVEIVERFFVTLNRSYTETGYNYFDDCAEIIIGSFYTDTIEYIEYMKSEIAQYGMMETYFVAVEEVYEYEDITIEEMNQSYPDVDFTNLEGVYEVLFISIDLYPENEFYGDFEYIMDELGIVKIDGEYYIIDMF
ncbi:hypothetical protein [Candidatus Xianfuyuplasma coldseepsis]|uniref:Lipoprotein n=1 Tax=Candidatus Xianfuyuplasma coldseepsis TaxID=2782163 RepID=A0A7L7KSA3_9MOLU|nr:hypothetical protein [Xianfuyuplasma coldseepsis]QMS84824.1 hypothetical protein G4Z02_03335 [Xianfuyuplasma coldseepsis]